MPKLYFILFIVIVLTVYVAMHWFVYQRLANGLALAAGQRLALKIFMLLGALSFVAGEFLNRLLPMGPLRFAGSVWLGIIAMAMAFFLAEALLSLLFPGKRFHFSLTALAVTLAIAGFSLWNGTRQPLLREVKIRVANLPAALQGFSIVHLSDLHLGGLTSTRRLRVIVNRVNDLKADLICVSGDVLDGDICQGEDHCALLRELRAEHGVVAVTGNHEFYAGIELFTKLAEKSNWRILRNQVWNLDGKLNIIGIDDDEGERFGFPKPDLVGLLRATVPAIPNILLYHRPTGFPEAARLGIDLQLSGHTHAGQIPPLDLLVRLIYRYPSGLYNFGKSHIYTSPGTGTWGPPMRFLSRSEITRLILER